MNVNLLYTVGVQTCNPVCFTFLAWRGFDGHPALAEQNAPASTVLLFEVQNNHDNTAAPAGPKGPDLTDPTEQIDGSGNGSISSGGTGGKPASNNNIAVYATGNIGGYNLTTISAGTVHSDGSNYAAEDGHVKFLRPSAVSGGRAAGSPTAVEVHNTTFNGGFAAGTGSMTQAPANGGGQVVLTFSPT